MRETTALRLSTDQDAELFRLCGALSHLCLIEDNGEEDLDGPAWLMWSTDGGDAGREDLALAKEHAIFCTLVDVWVTDYPQDFWRPDEVHYDLADWMGNQTYGQAAWTRQADAEWYEARIAAHTARQ